MASTFISFVSSSSPPRASSAPEISVLPRNRSPHVYPVRQSSGNTTAPTLRASHSRISSKTAPLLNRQSATLIFGVAAATLKNPSVIYISLSPCRKARQKIYSFQINKRPKIKVNKKGAARPSQNAENYPAGIKPCDFYRTE